MKELFASSLLLLLSIFMTVSVAELTSETFNVRVCSEFGGIDYCFCTKTNGTIRPPFNFLSFYETCRPDKCNCKDTNTSDYLLDYGCKDGGMPGCSSILSTVSMTQMICQNGKKFTLEDLERHSLSKTCICDDYKLPLCEGPDGAPKNIPWCPHNNETVNLTEASSLPSFLENCHAHEDFQSLGKDSLLPSSTSKLIIKL